MLVNILEQVKSRIDAVKINFRPNKVQEILKDPAVKKELKFLHQRFVFVPIDKASNNISIICKQLYASVIHKELDFRNLNTTKSTYTQVHGKLATEIIQDDIEFQENFHINVDKKQKKLPTMYWMPKMHKSPIGARFIVASKLCSTKPLSKDVASIFSLLFQSVQRYHHKAKYFSGMNRFWVIQNNSEVVDSVNKFNSRRSARSVSTFDFTTLYTNIPHALLIEVMHKIVDFGFCGGTKKKISVTGNSANFVYYKKNKDSHVYSKADIKHCLEYLIHNCYFNVGNLIFKQDIGIPIGSDPAPFFANLFLFHYESEWLKSIKGTEYARARKFNNIFRFIDDLIALNDGGEFEKSFLEIYPVELTLKKENTINSAVTFLDLDINIVDGKFIHKLFDKRNDFHFPIVRFPYRESNLPSKMFYSTISAEVLRVCRATTMYSDFLSALSPFLQRMKRQGAKQIGVERSLRKMISRHQDQFRKFEVPVDKLFQDLRILKK